MSTKRRSRNGAFLVELLIVIAVFAVCAAACVRVVGIAASEMRYAERLSDAQIKTADIAERYKSGTDIADLEKLYADGNIEINPAGKALTAWECHRCSLYSWYLQRSFFQFCVL